MNRHDTGDLDDAPRGETASQRPSSQSDLHYQLQSPSPPPCNTSTSGYGIGSAVWGLLRRISTIDNNPSRIPTPPPGASQLYHQNSQSIPPISGAGSDGINGAFNPPKRTATPRGLPSLEPLSLHGYRDDTDPDERLLSRGIAEEIRTFLPERLKIMEDWRLAYSLYQNGSSLATLYQSCEKYRGARAGFVLVVKDGKDAIFGAYLTEAPHPAPSYYGTGECFLWRASLHAPLPPPPSADTTNVNYRTTTIASPASHASPARLAPGIVDPECNRLMSSPTPAPVKLQSVRFQAFAYSGANDYCIFCETKFLSVGGGQGGKFGLWLDDSLSRGHSAGCDTFLNEPLSEEGEKFDIIGVEMWVVGAT
ncbi:TLD-domain-containing protein [Xylariaceae sp. FL0594]|nr:TLD-domain-containing protein [Xylariaceae sp. FL0594]